MAALTSTLVAGGLAAASAAASGAGAGIAGRKRRKAERKQREILNNMRDENESDFMRDYYQSAFDDPSAKSYLKKVSENATDQMKGIQNSGVSTGATHENVLAQKQAANEVVNDAMNNVVVNHESQKQAAKEQYIQRKDAIAQGDMSLAQQKGERQAQMWTSLGNNLADSINGLGSTFLGGGKAKQAGPVLNKAGMDNIRASADDLLKPRPMW